MDFNTVFNFQMPSLNSSSIPPQYVGNNSVQTSERGDVVILVPDIDADQLEPVGVEGLPSCIDTEIEVEPGSPKTITESSSKSGARNHPNRALPQRGNVFHV